jgi:hypothetical protein
LPRVRLHGADLTEADLSGAQVTDEQLAQAATLEGATLPDGTKYTNWAEPKPAPAEDVTSKTEGQPDQPGDLDTGEGVEVSTAA